VQETSCRETEGVPQFCSSYPPRMGDPRGLMASMKTELVGFASLPTLPAEESGREVQRNAAVVWGVPRFVRRAIRGLQRGEAPLRYSWSPKFGG
jgi:hypothetical protein